MPVYSYLTIQQPTEGIYKEKGSKFLAFAYPVRSEDEIKQRIEQLKKKYFDARHHCFAWMLDPAKTRFRAFDDGEPNHSAGDPILGQIRSKGVSDVLIVVVRYFGGVKLGVGGLINAYRAAAEDALNNAVVVEKELSEDVELDFDYLTTSDVMRLIKELDIKILEQNFGERCHMHVVTPLQKKEHLLIKLELMRAKGSSIEWKIKSRE